jgi:integrase
MQPTVSSVAPLFGQLPAGKFYGTAKSCWPMSPVILLAAERLRFGVTKRVGYHPLRHTLAALLGSPGANVKTTQELLLNANHSITMRIYQQAVSDDKRAAQRLAFSARYSEGPQSNPTSTHRGGVKEMDVATNH